ncbi:MAG TPA: HAMP domain-containing sensor histidine kinase [Rhizomicrobium sp.]|jgi:two-component system cell cycle sensor histidine kinase PleC
MIETESADATASSAGPGPERANLALEQLRLALKNLKPNHWLMPVFAAIVCVMFARWVSRPLLLTWFALVAMGGAPLGYVATRFLKLRPESLRREPWIKAATVSYFLFTIAWTAQGILFWRVGDDLNHMLIMLILACTLAGNSALVGASKPLAINGFAVYGLALVLLPLREGGVIYDGLAALAFLFVGYLAYMSRQIYFTARDMLTLRDDKNDLIAALAQSKQQSDSAAERAEAASRAKSQFLANMSHELRTPLNAILGFSEMIHSGTFRAAPGKHAEYARIIHQSGHHLLALINDILDLAKIEAGGFQLRESEIDLGALIADCLKLMNGRTENGEVTFSVNVARGLPRVWADERALKQVLLNLFSNAVKFTPPGGRIVAFARTEADGTFAFGVSDTGIGIAEDDQHRVFENFGQGRHDVVTADKGTGLGLPIVKGLVAAHGGQVKLESAVGEGTCVTVLLPASRVRPLLKAAS